MARMQSMKGRKLNNLEETETKKAGDCVKGAKPKAKQNKGTEFGSGRVESGNGSIPRKRRKNSRY